MRLCAYLFLHELCVTAQRVIHNKLVNGLVCSDANILTKLCTDGFCMTTNLHRLWPTRLYINELLGAAASEKFIASVRFYSCII